MLSFPLYKQRADLRPHRRVSCLAGSHPWCRTCLPSRRWVGLPAGCQARGPARDGERAVSPVPASSASSSPLEALEACLKGIPLSGSLPPQPPASSWFRSPQPGDARSPKPELQPRGSHSQGGPGPGLGWPLSLHTHGGDAEDTDGSPLLILGPLKCTSFSLPTPAACHA